MGSGPIISWQIDGETMETVINYFWGLKNHCRDGNCSHEVKRRLLLRKTAMIKLGRVFKNRDIILLTRVHIVIAMVFPVVVYTNMRVGS